MTHAELTPRDVLDRLPVARAIVDRCRRAGLQLDDVWMVGGAVRDAALGREVLDLDLAVEGDGVAFARRLVRAVDGELLATHDFGTATLAVPHDGDSVLVDVASARSEHYARAGALPTVQLGADIDMDLRRRDFTINAIAASLRDDDVLRWATGVGQPHDAGWAADLGARLVRVLHEQSFHDDPTRVFRALRYAARLGFSLEDLTRDLLEEAVRAGALQTLSARRIATEIELLCREPGAAWLELLVEHGVAAALDGRLEDDLPARLQLLHAIDADWSSSAERASLAWHMRLAVLMSPLGAADAASWLVEYGFTARDAASVRGQLELLTLVRDHDERVATSSPVELLDLVHTDDQLAIALATLAAGDEAGEALERYVDAVASTQLVLSGHDLLAMGVERGPAVGRALDELYRRKLAGELPDEAAERAAAREFVAAARDR